MSVQQDTSAEINRTDQTLFDDALTFIRDAGIDDILAAMTPELTESQRWRPKRSWPIPKS